jgi:outer membrane murein-binding lipoprotein Lpp
MTWVAWTARTLYQHAQIIAGLAPMPAKVDQIAADVTDIKVEQARLAGQLAK